MRAPQTICPKCGFSQNGGVECLRCGVIYARYRGNVPMPRQQHPPETDAKPVAFPFRPIFRAFRWVSMCGVILVLLLILRPSSPPPVSVSADAIQRAETKVRQFQAAAQKGRAQNLALDESELNGWLGTNLALRQPDPPTRVSGKRTDGFAGTATGETKDPPAGDATMEQVQSAVRDVKIELGNNSLRAYVSFELYGKNLSLELEGQLKVRDGYLRLEPSRGRLGSLPLLAGTLESAAQRLFDAPENKEKFRLPPGIHDVRVEQGELVISTQPFPPEPLSLR